MANEKVQFYGTGRRKSSVARVRLVPGNGQIIVNGKESKDYFKKKTLEMIIRQPLVLTETEGRFDVLVNAHGGGTTGQAGAVRLGIARALLKADIEYRPVLKKAGFLTRDPRMKERKKYGLKAQEELLSSPNVNLLLYTLHTTTKPRISYPWFFTYTVAKSLQLYAHWL